MLRDFRCWFSFSLSRLSFIWITTHNRFAWKRNVDMLTRTPCQAIICNASKSRIYPMRFLKCRLGCSHALVRFIFTWVSSYIDDQSTKQLLWSWFRSLLFMCSFWNNMTLFWPNFKIEKHQHWGFCENPTQTIVEIAIILPGVSMPKIIFCQPNKYPLI